MSTSEQKSVQQSISDIQAKKEAAAQTKAEKWQSFRNEVEQSINRFENEIKPVLLQKIASHVLDNDYYYYAHTPENRWGY